MKKTRKNLQKKLAKAKIILGASLLLSSCATKNKVNKTSKLAPKSISLNQSNSSESINSRLKELAEDKKCNLLSIIDDAINNLKIQIGESSNIYYNTNTKSTLFTSEKNKYIKWKIKQIRVYIESYPKTKKYGLKLQSMTNRLNTLEKLWKIEKTNEYCKGVWVKKKKLDESLETLFYRWKELETIKDVSPNIIKKLEYDTLIDKIIYKMTSISSGFLDIGREDKEFIKEHAAEFDDFIKKNTKNFKTCLQNKTRKSKLLKLITKNFAVGGSTTGYYIGIYASLGLIFGLGATGMILLGIMFGCALIGAILGSIFGAISGNYYGKKTIKKSNNRWNKFLIDIDNGKYATKTSFATLFE